MALNVRNQGLCVFHCLVFSGVVDVKKILLRVWCSVICANINTVEGPHADFFVHCICWIVDAPLQLEVDFFASSNRAHHKAITQHSREVVVVVNVAGKRSERASIRIEREQIATECLQHDQ